MRHSWHGKKVLVPVRGSMQLLAFVTAKERAYVRLLLGFGAIVEDFGNRTYQPRYEPLCSRFLDDFGDLFEVALSLQGVLSVKKRGHLLARSTPFDPCRQRPKLDTKFKPPNWI